MILYKFALIIDQSVLTVEAFFAKAPYLRFLACSFNIYTRSMWQEHFHFHPSSVFKQKNWLMRIWWMNYGIVLSVKMIYGTAYWCLCFVLENPIWQIWWRASALVCTFRSGPVMSPPPRKHRLNATLVHHLAKLLLKSTTSPGCLLRERVSC